MERSIKLILALAVGSLLSVNFVSAQKTIHEDQNQRKFDSLSKEIEFYLTEANYWKRDYDVHYPNKVALNRLRKLAVVNSEEFLNEARKQIILSSPKKIPQLVTNLIEANSVESRPMEELFTQKTLSSEFKSQRGLILESLRNYLNIYGRKPQSVYVVSLMGRLRDTNATTLISNMLNHKENPSLGETMLALLGLGAAQRIEDFVLGKQYERLCNENGYGVTVMRSYRDVKEVVTKYADHGKSYSPFFQKMQKQISRVPSRKMLIEHSYNAGAEYLRGLSILLLGKYKDDQSMNVIVDHLKNNKNPLLRFWAAQAFTTHPNRGAVDALMEAYMTDSDGNVRWASIESLGRIGDPKAEPVIKMALTDKNQIVREMAGRIRLNKKTP